RHLLADRGEPAPRRPAGAVGPRGHAAPSPAPPRPPGGRPGHGRRRLRNLTRRLAPGAGLLVWQRWYRSVSGSRIACPPPRPPPAPRRGGGEEWRRDLACLLTSGHRRGGAGGASPAEKK